MGRIMTMNPRRLTWGDLLVQLHAFQSFRRLPHKDGAPYGPGFFYGRDWAGRLTTDENRRVSFRLWDIRVCLMCEGELSRSSTGDHCVALVAGGPNGAQNYIPLCRSCNASKGRKDFLEWWTFRGRLLEQLPNDAICAYARLTWRYLDGRRDSAAPDWIYEAVSEAASSLPTSRHALALQGLRAPMEEPHD